MTDSATKGMLNALAVRSNARRAAYGLDAVTVPDPVGIFEYVETVGMLNGERNILRVKLRQDDEIIPMTRAMRMLNASEVEVRYWLHQNLLTALDQTQQWHDGRGMHSRHPEVWYNIHEHFCSLRQVTVKAASLPRLVSHKQVMEEWSKYESLGERLNQILEAHRIKMDRQVKLQPLNPIQPDGAPLSFEQPIHDGSYFLRNEIAEIAGIHFSDTTTCADEEVLEYALKITSTSTRANRLNQQEIVDKLRDRFREKKLIISKDSALFEDKIWPAIQAANPVYKARGRRPERQKA